MTKKELIKKCFDVFMNTWTLRTIIESTIQDVNSIDKDKTRLIENYNYVKNTTDKLKERFHSIKHYTYVSEDSNYTYKQLKELLNDLTMEEKLVDSIFVEMLPVQRTFIICFKGKPCTK